MTASIFENIEEPNEVNEETFITGRDLNDEHVEIIIVPENFE